MSTEVITKTHHYLTFKLDSETYAIDVKQIRGVLDFTEVTKVPKMPDFMCGVINLNGSIIPVVDLRLKLGLRQKKKTVGICIIIEITLDGETTPLAAIADSVQKVMGLESNRIEPAPINRTRLGLNYIKGIGKKNDDVITILDINRVFKDGKSTFPRSATGY